MNSLDLRKYFVSKYQSKFSYAYSNDKFPIEIKLLKNLLDKYSEFLILEAIDQFIDVIPGSKASILYFAKQKVFSSKFKPLINLRDIIKYKRLVPLYDKEDQIKIRRLVHEYKDYIDALSLNQEDVERKKEIVTELEKLKYGEDSVVLSEK